ncbi:hypothetical protein KI387_021248, partial [Taxus chinensis]
MVFFLLLVLFLSTALPACSFSPSYHSDQHALLTFKNSLSLDPLNSLHDWSPHHNTCNWTGVICSSRRPRVVSLNLTGMALLAPISPFLGNLSFLRTLALWNNSFHGQIPPQLGRLFRLRILRLSKNELDGPIPSTLGGCRSLQRLYLSVNRLTGTIPSQLALLSQLEIIAFGENQLTGTIPTFIGNMSSLTAMDLTENNFVGLIPSQLSLLLRLEIIGLGENQLTGTIPTFLANMSSLTNLDLCMNNLTGTIPAALSNCTHLNVLQLCGNHFTGHIPFQFGKLSELQELSFWGNQLTGEIPSSLSNCTLLQSIDLSLNRLSGTVPLEFGKLRNLQYLLLGGNHLVSGSSGLSILTALTNCSYLEVLELSINDLTGVLPSSVSRLSSVLSSLGLASNKLEGSIPSDIGNLTKLTELDLHNNSFNGTVPSTLGHLPHLERLSLHKNNLDGIIPKSLGQAKKLGLLSLGENMLSGRIPDSLGDLPQLRQLLLSRNQLLGQIPASLGRCITLEEVDLSYNKLRGNIPPEFTGLQNLQFYFNISNNLLQGSLLELSKMTMVQAIDVSLNHFSGEILGALSSCKNLQHLNLSGNAFEGPIPASLTSLKNLEEIDLSRNILSGAIPIAFKEMIMLQHINLSSNKLTGEVPKGGVFEKVGKSAVMGNPGLCGTWIQLQPCSNSKHKQLPIFKKVLISVVIGSAIFIVSFSLLVFSYRKRHTSQNVVSLNIGLKRISYEEIRDATERFSENNLIGVGSFGSVYRGILKNGTNIAVKVLNLQDANAHESFNKECNVLKRVRHRNVIKIISTCSNLDFDFKALVLPLMSNGSLERWLYPQGGDDCRLHLRDRLRIAVEIAQGMAYLHHYCFVQVIHCDLKPSNVLLGDDLTPYIADFGISKLLFGNSLDSLTSTNVLKGSVGYIAP